MAPNRRKNKASSAATAAAARQKWKVGDLVLAKLKGFPAWPAMVSEPEKWGCKPDSKKVLVFFFGTNQIAFCSHVDIEAFTEEKKQALQGKRYGKSADFVRAVKEITESYDKLKTQALVDDYKPVAEVTVTTGENSSVSLNPWTNEIPVEHISSIPSQNGSVSTKEIFESSIPFVDAASVKDENQNSPYVTSVLETPLESSHVLQEKPVRKNSLANVKQQRALSTKRSRTSRVDARRPQDNELTFNDSVSGRGYLRGSALCNESPKHTPPQTSLPVSNSNHEDSKSGIGSRSSFNNSEDSSFDSACVPEHFGTSGNSNEIVKVTKKRGLDVKAVFVKKKRKPNRRSTSSDSQELSEPGDKVPDSVCGVHNCRLNSPNACEKSNGSPSNVDGDEFLPLVKRARVRMSKLTDIEGHTDVMMHDMEEKPNNGCSLASNDVSLNSAIKVSSDCPNSTIIRESADDAVAQVDCTVSSNGAELSNLGKGMAFDGAAGKGSSPHPECIHQALEAMPFGAPEEAQQLTEEQLTKPSSVAVSGISSFIEAGATISKNDIGQDSLVANTDATSTNDTEMDSSSNAATVNSPFMQESNIHSVKTTETRQCSSSPLIVEKTVIISEQGAYGVYCSSLDIEDRKDTSANNEIASDRLPQYNLKQSSDPYQCIAEPPDCKISSSGSTEKSKSLVTKDDYDVAKITHKIDPVIHCADEVLNSEILPLPLCTNMPVHTVSAVNGEFKFDSSLKSGTSAEVTDSKRDPSHIGSDSGECSAEKAALRIQTSPSSVSGAVQPSWLAASLNPSHHTPNGSEPHNDRFVYPPDRLGVKIEEVTSDAGIGRYGTAGSSGKVTNYMEAKASLTSFGNALGTLTRTKDSIGRATRMAIECAKAGLAAKVVDIISRTLENESSLNRKVDLFFLVDSMMQCSRGLKGEVGGLYPSAIQASLPRLLSAAAPAGDAANENRRQCLKVLKLWLERRILPDSVIRHHMQSLDSIPSVSYSSAPYARRSSRTERAIHDPVREMEDMLVDEYGSNSSFQLSGFCMPRMRNDDFDGSDSDGENFEAVTPEHNSGTPEEPEQSNGGRHRHILEDVDGELEMEDVAPCEAEMKLSNEIEGISIQIANSNPNGISFHGPPLPSDVPPTSPPLPTSPPPPNAPPPPPEPPQSHSIHAPPLHPTPSVHSMPTPHPICESHGHSLSLPKDHPLQPHPSMHPLPPSAAGCPPPVYLPANGPDLMQYGNRHISADNLPNISPRAQPRPMGVQDPPTNCSFDNFSGPRLAAHPTNGHSVNPSNGFRHSDGPNYDNRGFNMRPPPLGPPNNYSSVDHRGHHSWREGPPRSFSSNYHRGPNRDDRNYYNDQNWRKPGTQERYEDRRYHGPPFPGDKGGAPYQLHPYVGPSNDHNRGGQGWGYPPRDMHHRNSMPVRPSSEGPRYWRQ